jgi:hypothetical protein
MAENKVVNTTQLDADLTSIANAIRAKAESSDSLVFPSGFVDAIANISSGDSEGHYLLINEKITIASAITTNQKVDLFQSDELKNLTTDYEKGDYEIGMIGPKEKVVTRGYYSLYYRGYNNSWNSNSSERLSIDESGTVKLSTGNVLSVNAQDVYLYVLAIKEA